MSPFEKYPRRGHLEPRILKEASDWLARRDAGFAPEDEARFSAWLNADVRHARAAEEVDFAWATLLRPRETGRTELVLRELSARRARRLRQRKTGAVIFAFVSAAAAAVLLMLQPFSRFDRSRHETVASMVALRPDRRTLSDGSVVELKPGAEIAVDFSPHQRSVQLIRGEALFAVMKNAARPFIVSAGGVEVRAVGTEFAVRFAPQQVDVLVTEGRVRVERTASRNDRAVAPQADAVIFVGAGNRVVVPAAAVPLQAEALTAAEIASALAWRGLRIEFSATPLAEAVQLFNRQNRVQLSLGDPAIAGLQISGVFWADDPSGFSRLLEETLGLRAVHPADGKIVLVR